MISLDRNMIVVFKIYSVKTMSFVSKMRQDLFLNRYFTNPQHCNQSLNPPPSSKTILTSGFLKSRPILTSLCRLFLLHKTTTFYLALGESTLVARTDIYSAQIKTKNRFIKRIILAKNLSSRLMENNITGICTSNLSHLKVR